MATILLLGLENDLARELSRVLLDHGHDVAAQAATADSIETAPRVRSADIVFASGDAPDYCETLRRLIARRPGRPVVIVNRLPDNSRWLDALELGAADYCGAPFEPVQMRWLVDSVLRQPVAA